MPDGFNGIKNFAAGMSRAGFGQRSNETRVVRAGQRHHGVAVRVGSHTAAMFMRWPPGGNEMSFVEMKSAFGGARYREMADVNRIESAAKQSDAAFACRLNKRAVALRRGYAQLSSVPGATTGDAPDTCSSGSVGVSAASSGAGGVRRSRASAIARTS